MGKENLIGWITLIIIVNYIGDGKRNEIVVFHLFHELTEFFGGTVVAKSLCLIWYSLARALIYLLVSFKYIRLIT